MEVLIKRNIKKLQSGSNVFHFNVQMERNIAEKTAVIKKNHSALFQLVTLKKLHNFKMVKNILKNRFKAICFWLSTNFFTFLKITLFEYFTLLKGLTCFVIMHYEVFLNTVIMSNI